MATTHNTISLETEEQKRNMQELNLLKEILHNITIEIMDKRNYKIPEKASMNDSPQKRKLEQLQKDNETDAASSSTTTTTSSSSTAGQKFAVLESEVNAMLHTTKKQKV
eukprot:TRINITY_DN10528_c0_g1_i3.p2 TRINITY_DN10528_c0_g1~~TRINITY_DN10528_c0_g1_i3.p2  ORF type:complete len:109 (+),score=61.53 TRINITY_DN10528_c0_g1_i3:209-535(+)